MSSAICYDLDRSKILSSGNGLCLKVRHERSSPSKTDTSNPYLAK